jgi:hypothetical protein
MGMLNSLTIKSSVLFVLLLSVLYVLLVATLCLTHLDIWVRLSILSLILLSFFHHLFLDALRLSPASWISLSLNENHLVVGFRAGDVLSGVVMERSVITPWCVVLCARLEGRQLPACTVIFRDAMQPEAFRQLRVRLKYDCSM